MPLLCAESLRASPPPPSGELRKFIKERLAVLTFVDCSVDQMKIDDRRKAVSMFQDVPQDASRNDMLPRVMLPMTLL